MRVHARGGAALRLLPVFAAAFSLTALVAIGAFVFRGPTGATSAWNILVEWEQPDAEGLFARGVLHAFPGPSERAQSEGGATVFVLALPESPTDYLAGTCGRGPGALGGALGHIVREASVGLWVGLPAESRSALVGIDSPDDRGLLLDLDNASFYATSKCRASSPAIVPQNPPPDRPRVLARAILAVEPEEPTRGSRS